MNQRFFGRAIALARIGIGVAAIAAPVAAPGALVTTEEAERPWAQLATRMTGIREIALGAVALTAGEDFRFVMGLCAACDAVDGLSALRSKLPLAPRIVFAATALPTAAFEARLALRA